METKDGKKKILLRVPNWIGDAVMSLPALSCLKRGFPPSSEVSVLAKKRVVPVYENNPDVSETIEYDDTGRHAGIKGRVRLSRELRALGFDMAVLFQNAFDAAFIAYLAGIPERAGYSTDLRAPLLTRPVTVPSTEARHDARYYLDLVGEITGRGCGDETPRLYLREEELRWAEKFLHENGFTPGAVIGAAPGASFGPAKRWAPENFARTLSMLSKGLGTGVLVFGGPEDREACAAVFELTEARLKKNLAGRTTLREFMAISERLALFITNDSGPMHIAASLGVPTIAVFGSTDPGLTGPLGKNARTVMKKIPCSPCFERTCRYGHYQCLASVTPAEVHAEALKALGKSPDGRIYDEEKLGHNGLS